MSSYERDEEDKTIYKVVVNHEEQYSIWPADRENALGWNDAGKSGTKQECLDYIKEVWTDMRPLSLRQKMEELARNPPPPPPAPAAPQGDDLVTRLSAGEHPVELCLRPEPSARLFKEAVERGYVRVKFTGTNPGTELGVKLDREACDFGAADLDAGAGRARLVGGLTLDYVKVRCVADVSLETMGGSGRLEKVEPAAAQV